MYNHFQMSISLLTTKFYIPPVRSNGVSRIHLVKRLQDAARSGCFALLSSPAGFGKTNLLSEFAAQTQRPVAWLSLDESDNDPVRFWMYFISACQLIYPIVGEDVSALLDTPQSLPLGEISPLLINDFVRFDLDLLFVLDDYHTITNETIHSGLLFILEHLPPKLNLIISTRMDPPWPLARFRARNQLEEIRARDLRFTTSEADTFLKSTMGLSLTSDDVSALEARTEGWAVGLQLAALSMQGRADAEGFVKGFTGSHVYVAEYLAEEVLHRLPGDLNSFLLQTSILDRLNDRLCEAVTGISDSQQILKNLYLANLFITPLDDVGQWFRYHHLFADLLKVRLQQHASSEEIAELHKRAAAWYACEEMYHQAIDHAVAAGDFAFAIELVGRAALPMILQANVRTVERWLQAVPEIYVSMSIRANMAFAWLFLLQGVFDRAVPYTDRLRDLFARPTSETQDLSIRGEWLVIQSKQLSVQGKIAESRDLADQALRILPESDTMVRSMALVNLASAYGMMLDYDNAIKTFEVIVHNAQAAGDYTTEILGTAGIGQMLVQQGRLHRAFEVSSRGIDRIKATGKSTPFSSTLYGEIGQIYYHWHQLEQSKSFLELSSQKSGKSGYSDPEIYRHIQYSRMHQIAGEWDSADQEMQAAAELVKQIPPAMVREEVISQQVRVDLAKDRLAKAKEVLRPEGFFFDPEFCYPELPPESIVPHPLGLLYNSALRVLLYDVGVNASEDHLEAGLRLAGRVLDGELRCKHLPIALETLLLRAQLHTTLGDDEEARKDIVLALQLAEPEGIINVFLEQGKPIEDLMKALAQHKLVRDVKPAYLQPILSAFPGPHPEPPPDETAVPGVRVEEVLIERLTPREIEVLTQIAQGDSNQSISEKLFITVSAVKKHTANIYGKLGVNSRTQALARARQHHLLP